MQKQVIQSQESVSNLELTDLIIDCIQDIKGKNIIKMDLTEIEEAPSDYFIVCEGDSVTQVSAIAGNIEKRLKDEVGVRPAHVEGKISAKWILVDYFNILVHIFYPETRRHYEIEDLWRDAKTTEYQDI